MPDPQATQQPQIDLSSGFVPKSHENTIDLSAGFKTKPTEPSASQRFFSSAFHAVGLPASPEEYKQRAEEASKKTPMQILKEGPGGSWWNLGGPSTAAFIPATAHAAQRTSEETQEGATDLVSGRFKEAAGHGVGALGYAGATALSPILGGMPAQAGEQIGSGDVAGGIGTAAPTLAPLAFHALAPAGAAPQARPTLKAGTEPAHVEALTGFLKTTKTDPHVTATTALPEARAVAAREGVNPAEFQGRRGGEMVTGKEGVLHKAIQEHRAEYAALRKPVLAVKLDTTLVAQAYLDAIKPGMEINSPEVTARLRAEAEKYATIDPKTGQITGVKPQTVEQLDNFRIDKNTELDKYEQSAPDKQLRSDVEVKADKAAADTARDLVYKTISAKTGTPEAYIRNLQQRQGALIEARRDLTQAFNDASGNQGEAVAGSLRANPEKILTLREKASHLYPSKRGLERSFVREVISPKPLDLFNNRLRMMFDKLEQPVAQGAVQAPTPPTSTTAPSPVASGQITSAHVAAENAFYTQARAELGASASPSAVLQRAQQLKQGAARIQAPKPPSTNGSSAPRSLGGAERSAAIAAVMSSLKNGDITEQEADRQIQRLNGGGGRKLIRFPQQPGGGD